MTFSSSRVISSIDCSPMARARTVSASRPKADCTACAEPPERMAQLPAARRALSLARHGNAGGFRRPGRLRRRRRCRSSVSAWRAVRAGSGRSGARGASGSMMVARSGAVRACGGGGVRLAAAASAPGRARRGAASGCAARRQGWRRAGRGRAGGRLTGARPGDLFAKLLDFGWRWRMLFAGTRCRARGGAGAALPAPARSGPMSSLMALRIEARRSSIRGSAVTTPTLSGTIGPVFQGLRESTALSICAADLVDGLHVGADPLVADAAVVLLGIVDRHLEAEVPGREPADRPPEAGSRPRRATVSALTCSTCDCTSSRCASSTSSVVRVPAWYSCCTPVSASCAARTWVLVLRMIWPSPT